MKSQDFIKAAIRTESRLDKARFNKKDLLLVFGMSMVTTAIVDAIKKNVFYGKPVDRSKIKRLMGQVDRECGNHDLTELGEGAPDDLAVDPRVFHAILGAHTETGELIEALYKSLRDDEPLDAVNLDEEWGDLDWYKAIYLDATGSSEETIRETVIAKLKRRYPDKFTSEKAINRDLDGERALLEKWHEGGCQVREEHDAKHQASAKEHHATTQQ
jgi:NTP pyrophosphatase (non-canonical NTP hydrolase)